MKKQPAKKPKYKMLKISWYFRRLIEGLFPGRFSSEQATGRGAVFTKRGRFVAGRDPIASIDWKTIFKAEPQSVFYQKMRQSTSVFAVDVSPSMWFSSQPGNSKAALAVSFLGLARGASQAGNRVGLVAYDHDIALSLRPVCAPGAVKSIIEEIIDRIARSGENRPPLATNDRTLWQCLGSYGLRDSVIFIISDFQYALSDRRVIADISANNILVPVILKDRDDCLPSLPGAYYSTRDPETGRYDRLESVYRNQDLDSLVKDLDLRPIELNTDMGESDITECLIAYFNNRRF